MESTAPPEAPELASTPQTETQATQNRSTASDATQPSADAFSDPLGALNSMWSGWMSPAVQPEQATEEIKEPPEPQQNSVQMAAATAAASDFLQGASKIWESAVKDVGSKLQAAAGGVDTVALGEQVDVIRQKSGQFVEDMSRSVQSMNLNLDQSELQKRAQVISSSTKDLLDKATQSLQQGHKEALEIFIDADPKISSDPGGLSVAPWDKAALPENEHAYADTLRQEMLKIVVDSIYSKKKRTEFFLSGVAENNKFSFDFAKKSGMALAALDADTNMRRLRAGLVPGKMKEDVFWTSYFYHVHRVRQALVANQGVMPEAPTDDDDDDPAALFADDGEDEELAALDAPPGSRSSAPAPSADKPPVAPKTGADGKRNWDDEIDAIFDDDE